MNPPGLVVLEGPDSTGKTTLAKFLLDGDNAGYVHLDAAPDRELWRVQYFALVKAAIRLRQGKLTVIDRHWISNQVYQEKPMCGRDMDRVVMRLCGVYVMCAPEPTSAVARHATSAREREELYKEGPDIFKWAREYRELALGNDSKAPQEATTYAEFLSYTGGMVSRGDTMLYDIDKDWNNLPQVRDRIFQRLGQLHTSQYTGGLNYGTPNFVGHARNAKVLFVGDVINPKKRGLWPFVDWQGSSVALCKVMQQLLWFEDEGMWTNAHAHDEHVKPLLMMNPDLKVVGLGKSAQEYLKSNEIEHAGVDHPSYAMRSGQKGLDKMKDQLASVLAEYMQPAKVGNVYF